MIAAGAVTRVCRSFISPVVGVLLLSMHVVDAQTVITPPANNKYTPAQDVELGRKAAEQVEQQLPILHEDRVTSAVASVGRRLASVVPSELQHPEFRYAFKVVNVREINAFALPGGPMYLNRGMIQATKTEGEMASVMAHEMSHVALRHGTAQATKATKYEVGQLLGAVVGAIIGGRVGGAVAQGTQFGLGTAFLRFSREDERQADLLGSHIMAQAGYDPREMANMFKTIEKQGGTGGPQWLSDHPNPGDRHDAILREAQLLQVHNPVGDTRAFKDAQARLRKMAPAPTTEAATKKANTGRAQIPAPGDRPEGNLSSDVDPPSSTSMGYTEGDVFRVSVPSNWRELAGSGAVIFAPEGAYGTVDDQHVFTHGMEMGVIRNESHDLRVATEDLVASMSANNPKARRTSGYSRSSIGGRSGLQTALSNVSEVTGRDERVVVFTSLLRDGSLFYVFGVAPRDRFADYERAFTRVVRSIELID